MVFRGVPACAHLGKTVKEREQMLRSLWKLQKGSLGKGYTSDQYNICILYLYIPNHLQISSGSTLHGSIVPVLFCHNGTGVWCGPSEKSFKNIDPRLKLS